MYVIGINHFISSSTEITANFNPRYFPVGYTARGLVDSKW